MQGQTNPIEPTYPDGWRQPRLFYTDHEILQAIRETGSLLEVVTDKINPEQIINQRLSHLWEMVQMGLYGIQSVMADVEHETNHTMIM